VRIGWVEVALILAIILIIFGPGKLPGVSGSVGQALRNFKNAISGKSEGEKRDKSADNSKNPDRDA
jgi:sec-independent protein translocase protein TatA